ncbi:hypothetical protein [Paraburkholderia sp. SIMBA_054]|uniref:hypothetical protein n=1 Tax=Paraburkholderia sp. SIMBA_054 TaxID=3085795 RepID=UPI00397D0D20
MGWKTLKERFGIQHRVQVTDAGICIGSGYAHSIVTVDVATGEVRQSDTFPRFLEENYPGLLKASAEEILRIIETPDTFVASITVYTFEEGVVIEKQCEVPGYPNITHDGCLMYDNRFSTDINTAVERAKRDVTAAMTFTRGRIVEAEKELTALRAQMTLYEAARTKLKAEYPAVSQRVDG